MNESTITKAIMTIFPSSKRNPALFFWIYSKQFLQSIVPLKQFYLNTTRNECNLKNLKSHEKLKKFIKILVKNSKNTVYLFFVLLRKMKNTTIKCTFKCVYANSVEKISGCQRITTMAAMAQMLVLIKFT